MPASAPVAAPESPASGLESRAAVRAARRPLSGREKSEVRAALSVLDEISGERPPRLASERGAARPRLASPPA